MARSRQTTRTTPTSCCFPFTIYFSVQVVSLLLAITSTAVYLLAPITISTSMNLFSVIITLLLILCPPAFGSNYSSARHRKLATCPDGRSCLSDSDCLFCSKSSGEPCTSNSDCPLGNGDRCSRTYSGTCSLQGPSGGGGGGGGAGNNGVCSADNETACTTFEDCKFCTKDPLTPCAFDGECPGNGNGNKCQARGSCEAPTTSPTPNVSLLQKTPCSIKFILKVLFAQH